MKEIEDHCLQWVHDIGSALAADVAAGVDVCRPKVGRGGLIAYVRRTKPETHVVLAQHWGYRPGAVRNEICDDAVAHDEAVQLYGGTIESYLRDHGCPVRSTPSAVAFELLRQSITMQGLAHTDDLHDWRWQRDIYKGGLSCVIRTYLDAQVVKIDRNSAYPYRMLRPLPARFTRHSTDIKPDGLYRARVWIPDMVVPPLQSRTWTGSIAYPVGRLTDAWTGAELLYAESLGVRIDRVFSGREPTAWLDISDVVQRFLTARAGVPPPYNGWCKVACNSLAGLLGKREFIPIFKIGEIPSGWDAVVCGNLSVDIGTREILQLSKFSLVGSAAHVTADTRIDLHKKVMEVGPENVLYLDTDAVVFDARAWPLATDIGHEVGQWKVEKQASSYACDALRRIRWDHTCEPTALPAGSYLCGRLVAGTWTVPGTIRELLLADLKKGKS